MKRFSQFSSVTQSCPTLFDQIALSMNHTEKGTALIPDLLATRIPLQKTNLFGGSKFILAGHQT